MMLAKHWFFESLRRWFSARQPREQRALLLLALFLAGVAAWQGLWQPVKNARDKSEAAYLAAVSDYHWIQSHAEEAKSAPAPEAADTGGSLLGTVTASAQRLRITITHAEPAEDGSLHVTVERAPFQRVVGWLAALQREHGIHAARVALSRQAANPGHVRATLTLR